MPYKEHSLIEPVDDNLVIWRYMDFTKFISIIDKGALYFATPELFNDPFEGSTTLMNVNFKKQQMEASIKESLKGQEDAEQKFLRIMEIMNSVKAQTAREDEFLVPKLFAVNCWHISNNESAAMWNIYAKTGQGIAIKTTVKQLKECFQDFLPFDSIYIGKVKYIDFSKDAHDKDNIICRYFYKRKEFEYEQELRAIVQTNNYSIHVLENIGRSTLSESEIKNFENVPTVYETGRSIEIDYKFLLGEIYLHPEVPEWFEVLVRSVLKKYDLQINLIHSKLKDKPIY